MMNVQFRKDSCVYTCVCVVSIKFDGIFQVGLKSSKGLSSSVLSFHTIMRKKRSVISGSMTFNTESIT